METYQWVKDSEPIVSADSSMLVIDSVTPNDMGSYYVILTNSAGSKTSNPCRFIAAAESVMEVLKDLDEKPMFVLATKVHLQPDSLFQF